MRLGDLGKVAATLALVACGGEVDAEIPLEGVLSGDDTIRIATYNVSLYRDEPGALIADLEADDDPQLEAVRAVIREVDPDILILNEFDYDDEGRALDLFAEQLGGRYEHRLAIPSNTGVPSGADLDNDGRDEHAMGSREYGNDAFGYGIHPGQYAFAVLSRFPIDKDAVRTFRAFRWKDLPDNLMPGDYYSEEAQDVFRLSSKNHADVPVEVGGETLHLILAHPTPPGFDGEENRNGRRNFDEVRFLVEYISGEGEDWIVDDSGGTGGLAGDATFVIAGDLNADPADGDVPEGKDQHAILDLLRHPRVTDPQPKSAGGAEAAQLQRRGNLSHQGDPALDTADFSDGSVGNLRIDYVLPSSDLSVVGSGIFWPATDEPNRELVGSGWPVVSSDHRLVWVDLERPGAE